MKSEIRKRKGLKHYGRKSENIIINCWKCPEEGQGAGVKGCRRQEGRGKGCSKKFYTGRFSREVEPLTFYILFLRENVPLS